MTSILQPMDHGVIQITQKYYRKSLLHHILLSYDNEKKYEIDLLGTVNLVAEAWCQLHPLTIANCFAHAGLSRAPASINKTLVLNSAAVMRCAVHKATGSVSDTEDAEIAFEEYALYEADVPVTGSCRTRTSLKWP
ncbi:hypothetical protein HPB51_024020 [Rhipicephalus microplus]|uniref:DDE-1 domain-containing protein n=1 Tax=Rhipicephalus microplus TaxID=6941 RepID=A0A9J6ECL8_RHIMP|nr:hypothetical protein HPB51_024020 [Rhipicephalus microplus]